MHMPVAEGLKSMHPAAKMCTQGAGCTLNFEHCLYMGQGLFPEVVKEIEDFLATKRYSIS